MDLVPKSKQYYPALDGLRAVAVTLVFLQHYAPSEWRINRFGWAGVDIFFVLSGFLITGILFDSRHKPNRFRDFYMRRVLRIFPLYYGLWVLLGILIVTQHLQWTARFWLWPLHLGNFLVAFPFTPAPPFAHAVRADWTQFLVPTRPTHFIFNVTPIGAFWSLCVEEQFYLVWPSVVYSRLSQRGLFRLCLWGALTVLAARIILVFSLSPSVIQRNFLYYFTFTRVDSLLLGGALALALRGPQKIWLRQNWRRVVRPLYVLGAAMLAWAISFEHEDVQYHPFTASIGFTLLACVSCAIILDCTEPGTWAYRVLSMRWLRAVGGISYGIYVLHFPLMTVFLAIASRIAPAHATLVRLPVAAAGTLLLASLSYRYWESPFLRLKSRFDQQVHYAPIADPSPENS